MTQYVLMYIGKILAIFKWDEDILKTMGSQVGVFGDKRAPEIALFMLHKMMNRAKKSSGIVVSNEGIHSKICGPDTPRKIISPHMDSLKGYSAIASSLASIDHFKNDSEVLPPYSIEIGSQGFSISLDGELDNYQKLAKELDGKGAIMSNYFPRDQVFTHAMHRSKRGTIEEKLFHGLTKISGNYSIVGMIEDKGFAAITPQETFSLYALQSKTKTFIASEKAAFQIVAEGYMPKLHTLKKLEGGVLYFINKGDISEQRFAESGNLAHCIHENIRFANPVDGNLVKFKESLGASLTEYLLPTGIQLFTGVPNSSSHFVNGFINWSMEKNYNFKNIITFMRNSYSGQKVLGENRGEKVSFHTKYTMANVDPDEKEIIIIKDTLRSGDSAKEEIRQIRNLGFEKVVYATAMPPMLNNCEFRSDFLFSQNHVGSLHNHKSIAKEIGADIYVHLPIELVLDKARHLGVEPQNFCIDCYA